MKAILEEFHKGQHRVLEAFADHGDRKVLTIQLHQLRSKILRSAQACARIHSLALQEAHTLFLEELMEAVTLDKQPPGEVRLLQIEEQEYIRRKNAIKLLIRPDVQVIQGVPEEF